MYLTHIPSLSRQDYDRAPTMRVAVAKAVYYALAVEKGDPSTARPLRKYFDMLLQKKENYSDVNDGGILPMNYLNAMNLRREMELMARYGRLHPGSTDAIGGFMGQIPDLIQYLDPAVPDPEYTLELVSPKPTGTAGDFLIDKGTHYGAKPLAVFRDKENKIINGIAITAMLSPNEGEGAFLLSSMKQTGKTGDSWIERVRGDAIIEHGGGLLAVVNYAGQNISARAVISPGMTPTPTDP